MRVIARTAVVMQRSRQCAVNTAYETPKTRLSALPRGPIRAVMPRRLWRSLPFSRAPTPTKRSQRRRDFRSEAFPMRLWTPQPKILNRLRSAFSWAQAPSLLRVAQPRSARRKKPYPPPAPSGVSPPVELEPRSHAPLSQARDRAYGVGGGVAVVPESLAERMRLLVESIMGEMEEMELLEITLARLKAENAALRARIKQLELQIT